MRSFLTTSLLGELRDTKRKLIAARLGFTSLEDGRLALDGQRARREPSRWS